MITAIGRTTLLALTYLGELGMLVGETITAMFIAPIRWKLALQQIIEIGARSQIVVAVTGAFTGAVFAAQIYFQFHRFGMDSAVAPSHRSRFSANWARRSRRSWSRVAWARPSRRRSAR